MEKLSSAYARTLVIEAIKSGSIKLRGASQSANVEDSTDQASIDAAYILKLFTDLTGEGKDES